MNRKPLWLRLKQRLYNLRYYTMQWLRICPECRRRMSKEERDAGGICTNCYYDAIVAQTAPSKGGTTDE